MFISSKNKGKTTMNRGRFTHETIGIVVCCLFNGTLKPLKGINQKPPVATSAKPRFICPRGKIHALVLPRQFPPRSLTSSAKTRPPKPERPTQWKGIPISAQIFCAAAASIHFTSAMKLTSVGLSGLALCMLFKLLSTFR